MRYSHVIKNLYKPICFLFFFLFLNFFFIKSVSAQIPSPYIDCGNTDDPEFHSLRPYQSSPCNKKLEDLSYLCGNDLKVKDNIVVSPSDGTCTGGCGSVTCHFDLSRNFNFSIDSNQSEFPIAGNTEDVANSQSQQESLDDVTKVNEYISWYLNGVTNRAEYGDNKNTDYETVNLSGPLKKLLPSIIQEAERIKTVENVSLNKNHDQIVVCGQEEVLGILGKTKPHECYEGDGTPAKADVYRLVTGNGDGGWDGDLSIFRSLTNFTFGSDAWSKRIPPLPWDFESDVLYKKAYNEWKGKFCVILPIFGLQCIDNPLVANKWAELFPYIPLSTTEDSLGKLSAQDATVEDSSGVAITDLKTKWRNKPSKDPTAPANNESILSFAHMGETVGLVDQLQSTYLNKNQLSLAQVDGETIAPVVGASCKIVDVRHNEGDQLFGEVVTADVSYKAVFDCTFQTTELKDPATGKIIGCRPTGTCTKPVTFASKIDVETPKIDELWTKTVAGNASILKRIYPKIGVGTPIENIKDIPGVSPVVHNTSAELLSTNPEIQFPHIGGILEYFLKGIQTALRPKGYGEITTSGQSQPSSGSCSPGSGPCSIENLLPYFGNDINKATKASKICNRESGSNPMSKNNGCLNGSSCDYSIGLFQVNLLAHCSGAFSNYSCSTTISCTVGSQSTLQACETRLLNPIENIKEAVRISSNGTNWGPWSAAAVCGIQ